VVDSLLGTLAEERSVWDTKSGKADSWDEYVTALAEYERLKAAVANARVRMQELGRLARQEQEERKRRARNERDDA
jgi:hypothetical protein